MTTADPRFDDAGTWIASSYVCATARDMARFGLLYLRDGMWDGIRMLPEGWVDHARRARSVDPDDGRCYGAHWWVTGDDLGTFWANGYEGQSITVCPALDLVVVRLGKSTKEQYPALVDWRPRMVDAFRRGLILLRDVGPPRRRRCNRPVASTHRARRGGTGRGCSTWSPASAWVDQTGVLVVGAATRARSPTGPRQSARRPGPGLRAPGFLRHGGILARHPLVAQPMP